MASQEMTPVRRRRGLSAPLALPAGFAALLVVGAIAAGTGGGLPASWVLILAAVIVAAGSLVAEPTAAPLLGVIGWLTVVGFSRPPYAQLRPTGPLAWHAAVTMAACSLAGAGAGLVMRKLASSFTLWIVDVSGQQPPAEDPRTLPSEPRRAELSPDAVRQDERRPEDPRGDEPERAASPALASGWPRRRVPDLSGGISGR